MELTCIGQQHRPVQDLAFEGGHGQGLGAA